MRRAARVSQGSGLAGSAADPDAGGSRAVAAEPAGVRGGRAARAGARKENTAVGALGPCPGVALKGSEDKTDSHPWARVAGVGRGRASTSGCGPGVTTLAHSRVFSCPYEVGTEGRSSLATEQGQPVACLKATLPQVPHCTPSPPPSWESPHLKSPSPLLRTALGAGSRFPSFGATAFKTHQSHLCGADPRRGPGASRGDLCTGCKVSASSGANICLWGRFRQRPGGLAICP